MKKHFIVVLTSICLSFPAYSVKKPTLASKPDLLIYRKRKKGDFALYREIQQTRKFLSNSQISYVRKKLEKKYKELLKKFKQGKGY